MTAWSFERRGAAMFCHALAPSFARLKMTPVALLEGIRLPTREPYTPGSHDRRDRQARSSLGRKHATRRDEARPALRRLSKPNRPHVCSANVLAALADHRQPTPPGRIGNCKRVCAGVHTVPDRHLHVPGVMSMFTFMCMCLSIVTGSCRVMSAEVNGPAINPRWDGMSIGMHCAAVSTHLRQDSIGRKTSESIIHQQQALQPAPALSSSDLARPRSGHATSNLGNGSFGTQGQSYAFCPPHPTWGRLVDKTHPVRPLQPTMTSSFPPRRSRGPN